MAKHLSAAELRELASLCEQFVWINIAIAAESARKAIEAGAEEVSQDVRKELYKQLLELSRPPLAPEVRCVLMKELGRPYRRYKAEFSAGATAALRHLLTEEKSRLKKDEKSLELLEEIGIHEAALANLAERHGMTVDALKKRLQRDNQRRRKK